MANGYGTPCGCQHVYICADGRWTYAGAPKPNELNQAISQYKKQYGSKNVKISNSATEEVAVTRPCMSKNQNHANIRSAIKRTIHVENDWAYRSKTILKDSYWRK